MVRYLDPFYGTDITESVFYKLASLHRSEIIKDFEDGSVFRITYSYVTRRGKTRVHEKFIFSSCQWWHGEDGQKNAREIFLQWISSFNKGNPFRRIFKVKVLRCDAYAYAQEVVDGKEEAA